MARGNYTDYLQAYPFWLMDVAPIEPLALPLFTPQMGFSAITSPEISLDVASIRQGNWLFDRKVIKGGSIGPLSMQRAVSFYESDFWSWTMAALSGGVTYTVGGPTYRRDLLLIHYFARSPVGELGGKILGGVAQVGGALAQFAQGDLASGFAGVGSTAMANWAGSSSAMSTNGGMFGFIARVPARAYMLKGCIPSRWKSGTDFDATNSAISIAELDFECEGVELIDLSSPLKSLYSHGISSTVGNAIAGIL